MKSIPLHWQILGGMVAGILFGFFAASYGAEGFVHDWIDPFGKIFVNALKLIAVPLIFASLVKGVTELRDISSFSRMGGRTIVLYITTTVVAVTTGLLIANVVQPGNGFSEETRAKLASDKAAMDKVSKVNATVESKKNQGPLQPLVDVVPSNILEAATNNSRMLQVIFFAIFFGIGMILIDPVQAVPVKQFFDGLNEVILKMIDMIMLVAPLGVFALLASQVAQTPTMDVLMALLQYSLCVVAGLAIMVFVFYPALLYAFTGMGYVRFFRAISPAQLMAFSTSSSAATRWRF